MRRKHISARSATGAIGLLLGLIGNAAAEDYYRPTKGYRVEPAPDTPAYVRNLSKTQFEQFRNVEWLDVGLDFRSRYEYRENDYRPVGANNSGVYRPDPDNIWLLRTRAFLGVKDILDPLRFVLELEDARSYNGLYSRTDADVNEFEMIQGYAELYFANALGHNRPISIRAGRQHLELLDRRLVGNNEFRNTTNNFEGYRVRFGKRQNNWDLDTFVFQPVDRLKYDFDQPDEDTWFYGAVLSWKQWSDYVTIQPYFLGKHVDGDPRNTINANRKADADIYSPGLRVYGLFWDSGFDFDADLTKQFGHQGRLTGTNRNNYSQIVEQHDALAYSLELGYTFDHDWKPRASLYYGYGTGDKTGGDRTNQRFDAFYGFNQPWSRNDYYSWDNIHAPKARLEFTPYKDVRIDTGYNAYWLESDAGGWRRAGLGNGNGKTFMGHEFDIRLRHKLNAFVDWSLSYAHYTPGDYTTSLARTNGPFTNEPSNFFYFEVSLNAFGDGKPKYH
ncbi:alginate export family protein [Methylomonas sp. EFPC3]|uniref:alginate export family protein n=1 Tax=Methylomonas sp. EFPC3 TaxID=3021710 RepID=UPI0024168FF2|nr:alginate export family protein [Methylomonas sp. EFPC3]WFP51102.1 alginate export family protein [Methylomonas sp. EFPC3]